MRIGEQDSCSAAHAHRYKAADSLFKLIGNCSEARRTQDVCAALPGFHAFSGWDTTSAFSGRGKKAALSLVMNGKGKSMKKLGESFSVEGESLALCERFTCAMYGRPALADACE